MVKFIDWLKHWAWFVLVVWLFVFWIYVVMWWNWLQATDGDVLTAAKWNELVSKVNWDITCPTWFTKIESQWRVYGCIQTDRNPTATFQNAIKECHNTYGWRLPSYSEIYMAITNYNLLNEWVSPEWVDQWDYFQSYNAWWQIWTSSSSYNPTTNPYNWLYHYRCFIPVR